MTKGNDKLKGTILAVGRYGDPEDSKRPLWIKIKVWDKIIYQPINEADLFKALNKIFELTGGDVDVEFTF